MLNLETIIQSSKIDTNLPMLSQWETLLEKWLVRECTLKTKNSRIERDRKIQEILAQSRTRIRKNGTRYLQPNPKKKSTIENLQSDVQALNKFIRPNYPKPPYRRDIEYPGGNQFSKSFKEEFDRLYKFTEFCYKQDGMSLKVAKMETHLQIIYKKIHTQKLIEAYRRRQRGPTVSYK